MTQKIISDQNKFPPMNSETQSGQQTHIKLLTQKRFWSGLAFLRIIFWIFLIWIPILSSSTPDSAQNGKSSNSLNGSRNGLNEESRDSDSGLSSRAASLLAPLRNSSHEQPSQEGKTAWECAKDF